VNWRFAGTRRLFIADPEITLTDQAAAGKTKFLHGSWPSGEVRDPATITM